MQRVGKSVRYETPARGNFPTAMALIDERGIPAAVFWRMFVYCRGCDHVMAGTYYEDHICDLSDM